MHISNRQESVYPYRSFPPNRPVIRTRKGSCLRENTAKTIDFVTFRKSDIGCAVDGKPIAEISSFWKAHGTE